MVSLNHSLGRLMLTRPFDPSQCCGSVAKNVYCTSILSVVCSPYTPVKPKTVCPPELVLDVYENVPVQIVANVLRTPWYFMYLYVLM